MLKNKKILITGATGFAGSNLLRRCLQENAKVHILTAATSDKWRIKDFLNRVNEHHVDLLDRERLTKVVSKIGPDIIFHLAAYGVYAFQKDVNRIIKTNFFGTINLINACKNTGFELFVNTGSVFEYGIKSGLLQENELPEPVSDYGASKAAATLYCQAIGKKENYPIVTLRLFTPYGYYEEVPRLIPSVIISCLNNENPKVSSPDYVRDFIFIEDVMDAYIKVAENRKSVKREIFNIASGKNHSIGEVVHTIVKLTNDKLKPEWGSVPNYRIESKIWQASISKAKKSLNWQPKYNLEQGLRKTIQWFRENVSLYTDKYCHMGR